MHTRPLAITLLLLATLPLAAQTLPTLQQSYEKAVAEKAGGPYQAAVSALNQKYSTALDRLTAAATQAGNLDEAISLRDEKKLLLPDGTLPEDSETTPATLKSARATYRQQITALRAARDAATQPLTDHFRTLLQNLLTQTTQAGKLDEAIALREKIAALGTAAPTTAKVDDVTKPTPSSGKLITAKSNGKTDPAAAQQVIAWALTNNATVTTSLGVVGSQEKLKTAPPGKFSVTEIVMNSATADFPWSALAGMGQLIRLVVSNNAPLSEEATRHFLQLGELRVLNVGPITEAGLQAMPVLPGIADLELAPSADDLPTLHLLQERTPSTVKVSISNKNIGRSAEAIFARLSGWPELRQVHSFVSINTALTQQLAQLPKLTRLLLFSGSRIDEGCIPLLPNLTTVNFNGTQPAAIHREVAALRNLEWFTFNAEGMTAADFPELGACQKLIKIEIFSPSLPAADIITKCGVSSGLYLFKLSDAEIDERTVELLLKFKRLDIVMLTNCRIAAPAIAKLKDLKQPKELNLRDSGISEADSKALQKALPKCKVIR